MAPEARGERAGPGRPSAGGREKVLAAGLEVLKEDGYAGLTTAKVAARSGQNKALIAYHFGGKQGLVAAAGATLAEDITVELLGSLGEPRTVGELVRAVLDGLWRILDEDERLARLYFDLAAVSVVEPEVRQVMRDMKAGWRTMLAGLLAETEDGPKGPDTEAAAVFVLAGVEGLALERLDRGETSSLGRAREMLSRGAAAAISAA